MAGNFNSGRKALPDNIKALTGTLRPGNARPLAVEGERITSLNTCLAYPTYAKLTDHGKAVFRRACKDLIALGLLEAPYLAEIAHYARWEDVYWQASQRLDKGALVDYDEKGNARENPALKIMTRAELHLAHLGSNFGLSPVERQKIRAGAEPQGTSKLKSIKLEAIYGEDAEDRPDDQ